MGGAAWCDSTGARLFAGDGCIDLDADLAAKALQRRLKPGKALTELIGLFLLVSLCCWQAGYFSVGDSGLSLMGYGLFRANVLTFFDPGTWSYTLRDMPSVLGDSDGFAFLGVGCHFPAHLRFSAIAARDGGSWRQGSPYPIT